MQVFREHGKDEYDDENDYYKILKFINKSEFTFTDVDNENNKGLLHNCNSKYKCVLCVNLKPKPSFHSSLSHRKYVTKHNYKHIETLNCSSSNFIYLITDKMFLFLQF